MTTVQSQLADRIRRLRLADGVLLARSNQGEVRRFDLDGRALVIKSPRGRGLTRRLSQIAIRREFQAYQRLEGLPGFPECFGLVDNERLALEFIDGADFRQADLPDPEQFFAELLESILAMHERGVAHGDLKRKKNLLVDADGRPVILDLGTATLTRPGFHPFRQRLFEFIRQTDLNAWIKLKYDGYDGVSEADQAWLQRSGLERLLGRLRRR
jgi:predicted Ser/Thr protein kinase